VRDDGIGMPATALVRTGLGTSIVHALAKQLRATVEVVQEHPGTKVSIHHTQIAMVTDQPEAASDPLAATRPASSAISG
jgi:nitrate/nitrite-specific signal transduction histidine kinase